MHPVRRSLSDMPVVWAASGNNRVHLWNVMDGSCQYALSVDADKQDEVVLNPVPISVRSVVSSDDDRAWVRAWVRLW